MWYEQTVKEQPFGANFASWLLMAYTPIRYSAVQPPFVTHSTCTDFQHMDNTHFIASWPVGCGHWDVRFLSRRARGRQARTPRDSAGV
jgi:hypothetical protein